MKRVRVILLGIERVEPDGVAPSLFQVLNRLHKTIGAFGAAAHGDAFVAYVALLDLAEAGNRQRLDAAALGRRRAPLLEAVGEIRIPDMSQLIRIP